MKTLSGIMNEKRLREYYASQTSNKPMGDQTATDNFGNAWMMDTALGQGIQDLSLRYKHDSWSFNADPSFNPYRDRQQDLEGYTPWLDEFEDVRSNEEFDFVMEKLDANNRRREKLHAGDAGWSRLFANIADPVNLVPVPFIGGIGFVRGAGRFAAGTAATLGPVELLRHELDPTSTVTETVANITGGVLLGSALGGAIGKYSAKQLDVFNKNGTELFVHADASEAGTRHNEAFGQNASSSIRARVQEPPSDSVPDVTKTVEETRMEDLNGFVHQMEGETPQAHVERLEKIAKNDDLYDDAVMIGDMQDPNRLMSTMTGVEKMRWMQHPYMFLKNTLFKGEVGSMIAGVGDELGGAPGTFNVGNEIGIKTNQSVLSSAGLTNPLAVKAREGIYGAFLRSRGMNPEGMTSGGQAWDSIKQTVTGKGHLYDDFKKEVTTSYLSGVESANPEVKAAAESIKEYYQEMGQLASDAGVFAEARLGLKNKKIEEVRLPKAQARVDHQIERMSSDMADARATIDDMNNGQVNSRGTLTKKQRAFKEDLEGRELIYQEIVDDPMKVLELTPEQIKGDINLEILHQQATTLDRWNVELAENARMIDEFSVNPSVPKIRNETALGHYARFFRNDAITEHSGELRKILEDHYVKLGDVDERITRTIENLTGEGQYGPLKRSVAAEMKGLGKPADEIAVFEKQLDDLFKNRDLDLPEQVAAAMKIKDEALGIKSIDRALRGDIHEALRGLSKEGRTPDVKMAEVNQALNKAGIQDSSRLYSEINDILADAEIKGLERFQLIEELLNRNRAGEVMAGMERIAAEGTLEGFGASTSLLSRKLDIPSGLLINRTVSDGAGGTKVIDFIETDPEVAMRMYHQRMSVSIAMAEMKKPGGNGVAYGDPTGQARLDDIIDAIDDQIVTAKPGERASMMQEKAKVVEAMDTLRQKVLGVYKIPEDPSAISHRTVQFLKNWMVLALMGKATIAAGADIGRVMMEVGPGKFIESVANSVGHSKLEFKLGSAEANLAGEGAEVALHGRWNQMFDLLNNVEGATKMERFASDNVNRMFVLNLLSPYTDFMKRFSGSIMQSEMVRVSEIVATGGKLSRQETMWMSRSGLDAEDMVKIHEQWFMSTGGIEGKGKGNTLYLANTNDWVDADVARRFRVALADNIKNAVITPGVSEKLNFMSTPMGGLMTQFKSFGLSATHRTTIAGLQMRDAKALNGMVSLLAAGMVVDYLKSPSYDNRSLFSIDRIVQGFEYSGAGGILFDVNNMIEIASNNEFGIKPLLGVDSFYKDPNIGQMIGQIGGPTASLSADLIWSMFSPEADGYDKARSVRRLLPYNNLLYYSGLVDRVQREIGQPSEQD